MPYAGTRHAPASTPVGALLEEHLQDKGRSRGGGQDSMLHSASAVVAAALTSGRRWASPARRCTVPAPCAGESHGEEEMERTRWSLRQQATGTITVLLDSGMTLDAFYTYESGMRDCVRLMMDLGYLEDVARHRWQEAYDDAKGYLDDPDDKVHEEYESTGEETYSDSYVDDDVVGHMIAYHDAYWEQTPSRRALVRAGIMCDMYASPQRWMIDCVNVFMDRGYNETRAADECRNIWVDHRRLLNDCREMVQRGERPRQTPAAAAIF